MVSIFPPKLRLVLRRETRRVAWQGLQLIGNFQQRKTVLYLSGLEGHIRANFGN